MTGMGIEGGTKSQMKFCIYLDVLSYGLHATSTREVERQWAITIQRQRRPDVVRAVDELVEDMVCTFPRRLVYDPRLLQKICPGQGPD